MWLCLVGLEKMQDYFYTLAEQLTSLLQGEEIYTCAFNGEVSDFVRFNNARVRQAGRVSQSAINVDLIEGRRHAAATLTLAGDLTLDRSRLYELVQDLREIRRYAPEDPFLLYATEICSSAKVYPNQLPESAEMTAQILAAGRDYDLVGCQASGLTYAGFANSMGQRNWHSRHSFNIDWSLFLEADKAVKSRYADFTWNSEDFRLRVASAAQQLQILGRPAQTLKPGRYRAYLSPMALEDIIDLMSWGGFSLRDHRSGDTPLLRLAEKEARLNPGVSISENTAGGIAPDFERAGFIRPPQVDLIKQGVFDTYLVSPRSAAEYGIAGNGADSAEAPLSVDMAPGVIPTAEALVALDTGLFIGNLWYLNYSDRNAGRMTGMTRFATCWVQNGRLQAPVKVMRFDDTLYNLLGDGLLGLTSEREVLLDPGTYGGRSNRSARLPGVLVSNMQFTL